MRTLLIRRSITVSASAGRARTSRLGTGAWHFLAALTVVQGAHMVEHVVQLAQVTVLGVADDDALGLLGYVVQFNGTEEWLHLGYNATFALGLYALILPLWRATPAGLPAWAFWAFAAGCVWLETWHMVEHGVIIAGVLAHGGCPCPGIGDAALGVTDTVLHFGYNAIATACLALVFIHARRRRRGQKSGGDGISAQASRNRRWRSE